MSDLKIRDESQIDSMLSGENPEILLEKSFNSNKQQPDFNDFDAVLNCVSRLDTISKLRYRDFNYVIDTRDAIEVTKDIWFELQPESEQDKKSGQITKISYRLFTDVLTIKDLKDYIAKCRQEYEAHRNNKLGDDLYFFDQATANDNRHHHALSFDKKKFITHRTFDNVFFEEKSEVEGRVKHFMTKKDWYMKRGIPYTLGFMFHGAPGTGKTSSIKSIANVTSRHIINVRLSEIKTNTQLKNLFYNPILQVINPETLLVEKITVPIHQRLYVIEDIDCMTDLIKRRELQHQEIEEENTKAKAKPKPTKSKSKAKPVVQPADDSSDDGDEILQKYYEEALSGEIKDMALESKEESTNGDKITFDSLLNILDGTLEIPDRMIVITTNHLSIIDEALIRPGRIDMIIEFKLCTTEIIKQMFESFYEQKFDISRFEKIKNYKISPAVVNQVLFKHFTKSEAAIEELVLLGNKRKAYTTKSKNKPSTP